MYEEAWQDLRQLVQGQLLAVLGTDCEGHPYTSLVAFAITPDLRHALFATTQATRKYRNLEQNPRLSLLIDNRSNSAADFHAAMAVSAFGVIVHPEEDEFERMLSLFLEHHPHLRDFVHAPSCSLLCMKVQSYFLVRRFQHVIELIP